MGPISRREGLFLMLGASQAVLLGPASAADSTPYSAKVSSRNPKLWMKLDDASGTPVDSSDNNLSVTLNGTPRAYRVRTSKGPGIDLGGKADIQIAHNAVFETDHGIPRDVSGHTWVYSEVALVGQFKINDFTDREDTYLFGKSDNPGAWAHSLNVWVTSDRRLRVNARTPWRHVRLDSPAHAITKEDEFHVCVVLGREGLWATLNGRMLNNGEKDPRHWYGWDHRVRGIRGFNDSPIRIGKSASGKQSNIVVSQFAVFVTGNYAKRLKLADARALAQEGGDPLGHPLFDKSTQDVAVGGDIQDAINARELAGGGTVKLAAGTHTISTDLIMKTGVRLKGAGVDRTTLNLADGASIGTGGAATVPTLTDLPFPGALSAGQSSLSINNSLTEDSDAILIVVAKNKLGELWRIPGSQLDSEQLHRGEFIPVFSRTGTTITTEGGLYFDYPIDDQEIIQVFNPLAKDVEITDLTITGDLRTGRNHGIAHFEGARRVALRRIVVSEKVAYSGDPGKLTNMINAYGCVDFVMEDVEWKTFSTFGDYKQLGASHPYGAQFLGGVNNVIMRGYGHSEKWIALDVGSDNFDQEWTHSEPRPNNIYHVALCRLETVDAKATAKGRHGPFGGHTSFACRWIGTECMNGGGWSVEGWQHEHADGVSHFPPASGYPSPGDLHEATWAPSSRGGCYGARLTFQGRPRRWWDGKDKDSLYVDIDQPGTTNTGKGPGKQSGCTYVNCDPPLPSKI